MLAFLWVVMLRTLLQRWKKVPRHHRDHLLWPAHKTGQRSRAPKLGQRRNASWILGTARSCIRDQGYNWSPGDEWIGPLFSNYDAWMRKLGESTLVKAGLFGNWSSTKAFVSLAVFYHACDSSRSSETWRHHYEIHWVSQSGISIFTDLHRGIWRRPTFATELSDC